MFLAKKLNNGAGSPTPVDAQFNYVTMLLHGDGTNGAQNNTFLDSGPNTLSITRNGNTTQGSFLPYGYNWSNFFDGSSYLTGPTTNSAFDFGSGNWTIETWAFPTAFSNQMAVFISLDNATSNSYAIGLLINTNGSVQVYQYGGSYFINSTSSTGVVTLNTWSHIAAVRSGSTFAIFVNGTRVASVSGVSGTQDANKTVNIGQDPYANNLRFSGYLSNLRVVKGTAVYSPSSSTITVPTTPLTAISGTSLLTCQANRFFDASSSTFPIAANGTMSVQRFNPFGTATSYSTSVIGGSGYFDGSGDYLTTPSSITLGAGDLTIEGWFYPANTAGSVWFDFRGNDSGTPSNNPVIQWSTVTSGKFTVRINGTAAITSSSAFSINAWYHVALVRSGTTVTLYVNGTSQGTYTTSTSFAQAYSRIGAYGGDGTLPIGGFTSDMRAVVGTAVYTAAFTPPTAPLTAISGTSLLLSMTNGAIFDNAMMNDLETVGNAQISTSVKKYGTGSMSFDGSGDWLIMPYGPTQNFGTGAFTIEGWFYLNSLAASYYVPAGTWGSGTSDEWLIQIQNDGSIRFLTTSGSTFYSASITTATWYHIAVVRSGSTVTIYVNGTSVGSYTCSNSLGSVSKTLYIGSQAGTWDWNGYIDDFRITNGYARYTANFTAPTEAFSNTGPY